MNTYEITALCTFPRIAQLKKRVLAHNFDHARKQFHKLTLNKTFIEILDVKHIK